MFSDFKSKNLILQHSIILFESTHVQFGRQSLIPSLLGSIWNRKKVLKLIFCKSIFSFINKYDFSEIPGVPTISMINIQADTETTLILLHIFTPSISSWQGDFTPVKVVSKQLSLKSFISFYNFWNIWN